MAGSLVSGCTGGNHIGSSRQAVTDWASERGFQAEQRTAGSFRLLVLRRTGRAVDNGMLRVYIEGDGASWPTRFHPPPDPTPRRPVALELAVADTEQSVVYLGRPCQYLDAEDLDSCALAYWTSARFAPEVVAAYQQLLDELSQAPGISRLSLVGYSGGGVLASLLAQGRKDVGELVTVAAPLSVAAWTAHHSVTPLEGLDPSRLDGRGPPGVHFAGEKDDLVPAAILEALVRRTGARLYVMPGFDHECCWARDWQRLLEMAR